MQNHYFKRSNNLSLVKMSAFVSYIFVLPFERKDIIDPFIITYGIDKIVSLG